MSRRRVGASRPLELLLTSTVPCSDVRRGACRGVVDGQQARAQLRLENDIAVILVGSCDNAIVCWSTAAPSAARIQRWCVYRVSRKSGTPISGKSTGLQRDRSSRRVSSVSAASMISPSVVHVVLAVREGVALDPEDSILCSDGHFEAVPW